MQLRLATGHRPLATALAKTAIVCRVQTRYSPGPFCPLLGRSPLKHGRRRKRMRHLFNRFSLAAFVVTLSLGVARFAFSDGPDDRQPGAGNGGPLILTLGPPPVVYSPSTTSAPSGKHSWLGRGQRCANRCRETEPTCCRHTADAAVVRATVRAVRYVNAAELWPRVRMPPPMHTAMQPQPVYRAPSYYAPAPNPAFMLPTMPVPAPPAYGFAVAPPSAPSPDRRITPRSSIPRV